MTITPSVIGDTHLATHRLADWEGRAVGCGGGGEGSSRVGISLELESCNSSASVSTALLGRAALECL